MQFAAADVAAHLPAAIDRFQAALDGSPDRWDQLHLTLLPHVVADVPGTAELKAMASSLTLRVNAAIPGGMERIAHESLLPALADLMIEAFTDATGRHCPGAHLFPITEFGTSNLPPYRRPDTGGRVYCLATALITD